MTPNAEKIKKKNVAPSKQKIAKSFVASISAVLFLVTQIVGLILIWGIIVSRKNNAIITMIARKQNYFRKKLACCWLKR